MEELLRAQAAIRAELRMLASSCGACQEHGTNDDYDACGAGSGVQQRRDADRCLGVCRPMQESAVQERLLLMDSGDSTRQGYKDGDVAPPRAVVESIASGTAACRLQGTEAVWQGNERQMSFRFAVPLDACPMLFVSTSTDLDC